MNLNRKDQVLKAIVEEYVKTAEPVGSETILRNYSLNCSSATVRNTMAVLEKEGLIEKTHVSSGRVPSAKGYQYYLEHLDETPMNLVDLDFQRALQEMLNTRIQSVEDVLGKSCEMLSEMTHMATIFLGPKAEEEHLISIQLLKLSEKEALGVFITDSGHVEKKTFVIDPSAGYTYERLNTAVKFLSDHLCGTKVSELDSKAKVLEPVAVRMFGKEGEAVIHSFLEALLSFAQKKFTVYGQKNLLAWPEFSGDKETFLSAWEALDDPSKLEHSLSEKDDLGGSFNVGFTNDNLGDLAIVTAAINGKDQIAVVGPKRMDYKKIMSAMEYVVYMLNRYFSSQSDANKNALVPVSEATDVPVPAAAKKTNRPRKGGRKS